MLSNLVYARLSEDANLVALVGNRIFPTAPQSNDVETLPYLVYAVETTPNINLDGASSTTQHSVTVLVAARKLSDVQAVLDATRPLLKDWSEPGVQWSFWTGETTDQTGDGEGYNGTQSFEVWTN